MVVVNVEEIILFYFILFDTQMLMIIGLDLLGIPDLLLDHNATIQQDDKPMSLS